LQSPKVLIFKPILTSHSFFNKSIICTFYVPKLRNILISLNFRVVFSVYLFVIAVEGGILFYIDETIQHRLVAASEDLSDVYKCGCNWIEILGADGTGFETGLQNTIDIAVGCSKTPLATSEASLSKLVIQIVTALNWWIGSDE